MEKTVFTKNGKRCHSDNSASDTRLPAFQLVPRDEHACSKWNHWNNHSVVPPNHSLFICNPLVTSTLMHVSRTEIKSRNVNNFSPKKCSRVFHRVPNFPKRLFMAPQKQGDYGLTSPSVQGARYWGEKAGNEWLALFGWKFRGAPFSIFARNLAGSKKGGKL